MAADSNPRLNTSRQDDQKQVRFTVEPTEVAELSDSGFVKNVKQLAADLNCSFVSSRWNHIAGLKVAPEKEQEVREEIKSSDWLQLSPTKSHLISW